VSADGRRLRITAAHSINRGKTIAAFDAEFGGLEICDLMVLRGPHGLFISMPHKPRLDQVGRQLRDENSKRLYEGPLIRWVDAGSSHRFKETCLAVLQRDYPGVLSGVANSPQPPLPLPASKRRGKKGFNGPTPDVSRDSVDGGSHDRGL
jgi:hypothetical protein